MLLLGEFHFWKSSWCVPFAHLKNWGEGKCSTFAFAPRGCLFVSWQICYMILSLQRKKSKAKQGMFLLTCVSVLFFTRAIPCQRSSHKVVLTEVLETRLLEREYVFNTWSIDLILRNKSIETPSKSQAWWDMMTSILHMHRHYPHISTNQLWHLAIAEGLCCFVGSTGPTGTA